MNFLDFENACLNLEFSSSSDVFHSWWFVLLEKYQFCSLHQNPDSQKTVKGAIDKDFFLRNLDSYISTPIDLNSLIKVPIENLIFAEDGSFEEQIFDPSIIIPIVRKFKKCLLLFVCLDNQTHISHKRQAWFLGPNLHWSFSKSEDNSVNKTFVLTHAGDSWQSNYSKRCYLCW